jgi:uncharacterized protein (TIGR03083 family)
VSPTAQTDPGFVFQPKPAITTAGTYPAPPPAPSAPPSPTPGPPVPASPLDQLVGTWHGTGFNTIWRPHFPDSPQDRFLELNLTDEILAFSPINGPIPNRGLLQKDIKMFGLTYMQQISDSSDEAGLHVEPGIWAIVPETTNPAEPPTVIRMASIPHGTVILTQGTASTAAGAPAIPDNNIIPFGIGATPPPNTEFSQAAQTFTWSPMGDDRLDALSRSVERLRVIAGALSDDQLTDRAYPAEWSISQVLSHLGSGAVISQRRLADAFAGRNTPDDFAQGVWDDWNAKPPAAQRADGLAADAALVDALQAATPEQHDRFAFSMGPFEVDFYGFVGLRLNEHALHTWDIDVALDPRAVIPAEIAARVADNLDLIARFTAKPTGDSATITVATPDRTRGLSVELTPEAAAVTTGPPAAPADIELDDETLVRLVYGRLDPDHTPNRVRGLQIDTLRRVFPGP